MQDFLVATDKKDAEKFFEEQFLPVWSGVKVSKEETTPPKFTATQQADIYRTSNTMLKLNAQLGATDLKGSMQAGVAGLSRYSFNAFTNASTARSLTGIVTNEKSEAAPSKSRFQI